MSTLGGRRGRQRLISIRSSPQRAHFQSRVDNRLTALAMMDLVAEITESIDTKFAFGVFLELKKHLMPF